jgi:hypothetical protein
MRTSRALVVLAGFASREASSQRLYSSKDANIVELDWAMYEGHVRTDDAVWVLEWFTQTCPACRMISAWVKEAALIMKDDPGSSCSLSYSALF